MSDTITQSDLDLLISADTFLTQLALSFRRRLAAGATLEPGPLGMKEDDSAETVEEMEALGPPSVIGLYGITVSRATK